MANDLSYTANGNGHTVWRGGKRIGRVRKAGLYWHAYTTSGAIVHGTFGSMSAAAERLNVPEVDTPKGAPVRLTDGQREALRRAVEFGHVTQERGDGNDHLRPEVANRRTLASLEMRGLIAPVTGPRYMPSYTITDAGRAALGD